MAEYKKIKLELPEGMKLPNGCELPEIEVASATLKRTLMQVDGKMIEIEEKIEVPKIIKEI